MIPLQGGAGPIEELLRDNTGLAAGTADTVASLVIFVGAFVLLYVVGRATVLPIVRRLLKRRGLDEHARAPLLKLASFAVVFAAIAIAFGAAGYGNFLSSLAVIAAAATLAVGFALQGVLQNFVAGIFIYSEKPFRTGDWIEWDDETGVVEDISLRVTRVRTFDNELLTVPNSILTGGVLKNPVAKDELRMNFTFGIGYDDDIDRATEIVVEEAEAVEAILDDPEPSVRLTELGGSYVGLTSRFWIENPSRSEFVGVRGEYVQAVKERFDEEDVDIPYPTRTLTGGVEVAGLPESNE